MDNNDIEIIDTNWINEFEKEENDYLSYYNENINYLKVFYIYINTESEIHKIKEEKIHLLVENCLTKNELIKLIKDNVNLDNIKYSLLLLLKYNVLLKPNELKYFLKTNSNNNNSSNYLNSIINIEDIHFEKTITMFHDINSLFIVLYQKHHINNINNLNNNTTQNVGNSITKKVFFKNKLIKNNKNNKLNKTIKKTT